MRRGVARWCRAHPLFTAVLLVVACAGVGYGAAAAASGKLRDALLVAATTLSFGALLGGVVKLLLEDVQRERERRNEQVRFVKAVLDDLKSVYDRVERVRILIAAHQSALTYGNEMRDLIDSAVQLRNVRRALDQETSGIEKSRLDDLDLAVGSMEVYLNSLTDEFRERYKPIADKQRVYEAAFTNLLKQGGPAVQPPHNPAWEEIETLPMLREFRDAEPPSDGSSASYERDFGGALDLGTWILRSELTRLAGKPGPKMPRQHAITRERLTAGSARRA